MYSVYSCCIFVYIRAAVPFKVSDFRLRNMRQDYTYGLACLCIFPDYTYIAKTHSTSIVRPSLVRPDMRVYGYFCCAEICEIFETRGKVAVPRRGLRNILFGRNRNLYLHVTLTIYIYHIPIYIYSYLVLACGFYT